MSLEHEARVNELRATAHPLRLQMLSLLTGAELSAAEVARELDITQANASYHLRFLQAAGLIDLTGERVVRGGKAKLYRHLWDAPRRPTAGATDDDQLAYVQTLAGAIVTRYMGRQDSGPANFTDADLWVTPDVWKQAVDLVTQASRLVHASAQPPRTEGTMRANLSVAAFPLRETERGAR